MSLEGHFFPQEAHVDGPTYKVVGGRPWVVGQPYIGENYNVFGRIFSPNRETWVVG